MTFPLVSIILPTYNRAEWLPKSIGSVLNQTYQSWELIIWDDGSADATQEVLQQFQNKDNRIRCFRAENHGKSFALNQALKYAEGEFIAFLDDDDEWVPEKIQIQVDIMCRYPQIDLLFTNFHNRNSTTEQVKNYFEHVGSILERLETKELSAGLFLIASGIPESLLITNFVLPSSTIIKKDCYEKVGNFNEQLRVGEDLEYWWRMSLEQYLFAYADALLLTRNKHPNSASSFSPRTYLSLLKTLEHCSQRAQEHGREDLQAYFKPAFLNAWQQLILLYGMQNVRTKALNAFAKSTRYGLALRSVYLFVAAMFGRSFIESVQKHRYGILRRFS